MKNKMELTDEFIALILVGMIFKIIGLTVDNKYLIIIGCAVEIIAVASYLIRERRIN